MTDRLKEIRERDDEFVIQITDIDDMDSEDWIIDLLKSYNQYGQDRHELLKMVDELEAQLEAVRLLPSYRIDHLADEEVTKGRWVHLDDIKAAIGEGGS